MTRLDPSELHEQLRIRLLVAPKGLREDLVDTRPLVRAAASDKLAALLAEEITNIELLDAEPLSARPQYLPLFPSDRGPVELTWAPAPTPEIVEVEIAPEPPPFGRWLLDQVHRDDAIGLLARGAARDPRFPRNGDARAVSVRLNEQQADPEIHVALDDAELDWLAL